MHINARKPVLLTLGEFDHPLVCSDNSSSWLISADYAYASLQKTFPKIKIADLEIEK